MGYPEGNSERAILRSEAGAARLDEVRPVLTAAEVLSIQQEVERVRVDESLVSYTLEIVRRTRESEYLSLGVSPRGCAHAVQGCPGHGVPAKAQLLRSRRLQATRGSGVSHIEW